MERRGNFLIWEDQGSTIAIAIDKISLVDNETVGKIKPTYIKLIDREEQILVDERIEFVLSLLIND